MKARAAILFGALALGAVTTLAYAATGDPMPGMSVSEVESLLGQPQAKIDTGSQILLLYPRGRLIFQEGRLTDSNLLSEQAYAQQLAEEARAAELRAAARAEAARREATRNAEGQAELEKLLAGAEYKQLSGSGQLTVLAGFQARYPGLDITPTVLLAQQRASQEEQHRRYVAGVRPAAIPDNTTITRRSPNRVFDGVVLSTGNGTLRSYNTWIDWSCYYRPAPIVIVNPPHPPIRIIRQ